MKYIKTFESIYSTTSKNLGFASKTSIIPSLEDAEKWIEKAKTGDVEYFQKLFHIVRFAIPKNNHQTDVVNLIYDGWKDLKDKFN